LHYLRRKHNLTSQPIHTSNKAATAFLAQPFKSSSHLEPNRQIVTEKTTKEVICANTTAQPTQQHKHNANAKHKQPHAAFRSRSAKQQNTTTNRKTHTPHKPEPNLAKYVTAK